MIFFSEVTLDIIINQSTVTCLFLSALSAFLNTFLKKFFLDSNTVLPHILLSSPANVTKHFISVPNSLKQKLTEIL